MRSKRGAWKGRLLAVANGLRAGAGAEAAGSATITKDPAPAVVASQYLGLISLSSNLCRFAAALAEEGPANQVAAEYACEAEPTLCRSPSSAFRLGGTHGR